MGLSCLIPTATNKSCFEATPVPEEMIRVAHPLPMVDHSLKKLQEKKNLNINYAFNYQSLAFVLNSPPHSWH